MDEIRAHEIRIHALLDAAMLTCPICAGRSHQEQPWRQAVYPPPNTRATAWRHLFTTDGAHWKRCVASVLYVQIRQECVSFAQETRAYVRQNGDDEYSERRYNSNTFGESYGYASRPTSDPG